MKNVTLKERLRYRFDNYMSKGTVALIGGLAILSLVIIVLAAIFIQVMSIRPEGWDGNFSFFEAAWEAMMRTLDAGTMGSDTGWGFRLVMFAVTVGGVFIISSLIGVLTSGLEGKLDELRKGRSRVIETNHTVILGWSAQIFTIISELVIANENQHRSCIVILGDKDKVEMEEEIRAMVSDTGRTSIVCRSGCPIDLIDLELVSLHTARSIIVLSPEDVNPDANVIKTVLAITNNPHRRSEPYHIVAEIRDPKNTEIVRMVGSSEVEVILVGNTIARIIAQTCRQSGLSVVYTELLNFEGDEIYFKAEPSLEGKTFADSLFVYDTSSVIGLYTKDGTTHLNPPMETVIQPGDKIIAISEDDDTLSLSDTKDFHINPGAIRPPKPRLSIPERTLILGWNWRAPIIINELDAYVTAGSEVTVVADCADAENEIQRNCSGVKNQKIVCKSGDTTDRQILDELKPHTYQHVIVLSSSDQPDKQEADAHTLITLLHLRDIASQKGKSFAIVSEMLDLRNRALAEVTHADDFIVSDQFTSLMLAQVSENKYLNTLFEDIFDPEGSEIYLKPADDYILVGAPVNFYTVMEAARQRGEVAIGYRLASLANDSEQSYGVVVNPDKSKSISLSEMDRIIVIAED